MLHLCDSHLVEERARQRRQEIRRRVESLSASLVKRTEEIGHGHIKFEIPGVKWYVLAIKKTRKQNTYVVSRVYGKIGKGKAHTLTRVESSKEIRDIISKRLQHEYGVSWSSW